MSDPFSNYQSWHLDPKTGQYVENTGTPGYGGSAFPGSTNTGLPSGSTPAGSTPAVDPDTASATKILTDMLAQWGLSGLGDKLGGLIKDYGASNTEAIILNLKSTPEWQTRFAANAARVKAGLRELSPAEYIQTENSYRQVLQSFGLPSTFYDSQDDYRKFLELDVSPTELQDRAKIAQQTWLSQDQATKDTWRSWYGLSDGAAIASILDPSKALPIVQSMAEAAKAGGIATQNGLDANESRIRGYVDAGISGDQIAQGFGDIGVVHATDQAIGRRFGTDLSQTVEEQSRIQGLASAKRAQQDAYDSEKALFSGRPGADQTSLNRRTSGSY